MAKAKQVKYIYIIIRKQDMKLIFTKGNTKQYTKTITAADLAAFDAEQVHAVYSTFSLARDAEWAGRLFVLEMKETHEEGIGTFIQINHLAPAFEHESVKIEATFVEVKSNKEIIIAIKAMVQDRLIATGQTGQRILPKEKIDQLFSNVKPK
jgi:fluoroacetyl-CoA thioesterase